MVSPELLDEFVELVEFHFGIREFIAEIIKVRRAKYATSHPDQLSDMLETVFWATAEGCCDTLLAGE